MNTQKQIKDIETKAIENILKILLPLPEYQKKQIAIALMSSTVTNETYKETKKAFEKIQYILAYEQ
jgi:hypothetical protein